MTRTIMIMGMAAVIANVTQAAPCESLPGIWEGNTVLDGEQDVHYIDEYRADKTYESRFVITDIASGLSWQQQESGSWHCENGRYTTEVQLIDGYVVEPEDYENPAVTYAITAINAEQVEYQTLSGGVVGERFSARRISAEEKARKAMGGDLIGAGELGDTAFEQ